MANINITSKLLNKSNNKIHSINTKGIVNKEKIVFYEDEIMNIFYINEVCLERKCKEYNIKMDFKNNNGIIFDEKINVDFKIKTNYINISNNYIEIDYIIYMDGVEKYNYKVEW